MGMYPDEVLLTADQDGQLPLHMAILYQHRNLELFDLLLHSSGKHVNFMLATADRNGRLPVHCALERRQRRGGVSSDVLRMLMGPSPYHALAVADNEGRRPL